MAARAAPWRSKPSQALQVLLAQLSSPAADTSTSSCCLLQRLGPTSFLICQQQQQEQQEGVPTAATAAAASTAAPAADSKFRVVLDNRPTCSCAAAGAAAGSCGGEPCIHLLFVLVKVLRLPPTNPLVWQSALTDRELQQLLDGNLTRQQPSSTRAAHRSGSSSSGGSAMDPAGVARRGVEEGEPCPICYEPLLSTPVQLPTLVWCTQGCGRSIHGKCMRVWASHQASTLQQELSCPLCRCPWGTFKWSEPPPPPSAASSAGSKAVSAEATHRGRCCGGCQMAPIQGSCYRCHSCAGFDLCSSCFAGGHHLQHSFACCSAPGLAETAAERPLQCILQCNRVAQPQQPQHPQQQQLERQDGASCSSHSLMSVKPPPGHRQEGQPAAAMTARAVGPGARARHARSCFSRRGAAVSAPAAAAAPQQGMDGMLCVSSLHAPGAPAAGTDDSGRSEASAGRRRRHSIARAAAAAHTTNERSAAAAVMGLQGVAVGSLALVASSVSKR